MAIINPPPEPDLNYYKQAYPELNYLPDDVLGEHCIRFAIEQGRSTCPYDRSEYLRFFLQDTIDKHHLKALEISPWDRPFLRGENIKYFGIEDAEALRKSAIKTNRHNNNVPEKIHFISPTGDLGVVNETFDIVFSSHVIEHCPDLIEHIHGVTKILNSGGVYVLVVPDKRYCFDYYHPESTIEEVIDAFANEKRIPRLTDVIGTVFTRTHNNAVLHWLGYHGERYGYRNNSFEMNSSVKIMDEYFFDDGSDASFEKFSHLVEKYSDALSEGIYINAHNWRFTPENFRYIFEMLNKLSLIDLSILRLCHTIWGRQEFVAMLEKT